jgi:hypothetical protein
MTQNLAATQSEERPQTQTTTKEITTPNAA